MPLLEFPVELRKIVYTTNAIEPLKARFRPAVRHRGHFPTNNPRSKSFTASLRNDARTARTSPARFTAGTILNALTVHYGDRITNNY